jgi:hypothetical protein
MEHHKSGHNRADPFPIQPADDLDYETQQEMTTREGGFVSSGELGGLALAQSSEQKVFAEDDFIYEDALTIAADFFEASGGEDIQPEQYIRLVQNKWTHYELEEVLRVFNSDWQEFQARARKVFEQICIF